MSHAGLGYSSPSPTPTSQPPQAQAFIEAPSPAVVLDRSCDIYAEIVGLDSRLPPSSSSTAPQSQSSSAVHPNPSLGPSSPPCRRGPSSSPLSPGPAAPSQISSTSSVSWRRGSHFPTLSVPPPPSTSAAPPHKRLKPSTAPPLTSSNVGYKMLAASGWTPGTGLGTRNQGGVEPVKVEAQGGKGGLGAKKKGKEKVRVELGRSKRGDAAANSCGVAWGAMERSDQISYMRGTTNQRYEPLLRFDSLCSSPCC